MSCVSHAQYPKWWLRAQLCEPGLELLRRVRWGATWTTQAACLPGNPSRIAPSRTAWPGSMEAWVAASEDGLKYYMDRNFLDETNVFQFLTHTYISNNHTVEGLQTGKGSFLAGTRQAAGSGRQQQSGRQRQFGRR